MQFDHLLKTDFLGFELGDATLEFGLFPSAYIVRHPGMRIGHALEPEIHFTPGLKGIVLKVIENLVKGIGRVVGVDQGLLPVKLKVLHVHVDLHRVVDMLLPFAS